MSTYLTKDERSRINRRAHQLATQLQQTAYEAYRLRLVEWASQQKLKTAGLDEGAIEYQTPDISDLMEGVF